MYTKIIEFLCEYALVNLFQTWMWDGIQLILYSSISLLTKALSLSSLTLIIIKKRGKPFSLGCNKFTYWGLSRNSRYLPTMHTVKVPWIPQIYLCFMSSVLVGSFCHSYQHCNISFCVGNYDCGFHLHETLSISLVMHALPTHQKADVT